MSQAVEITNDITERFKQEGWFRIGEDLWRHIDTTEELDTFGVITKLATDDEKSVIEIIDNDLTEALNTAAKAPFEEVSTPDKPSFPEEITAQLKQQFCVITGKAGTGKSTLLRLEDEKDKSYIEKCSTTGIAAINCGGRTVNSALKYFNTPSLQKSYDFGNLHKHLRLIRERKRILGIDEVSMLDAKQLDILISAIEDINMDAEKPWDLGLHLIGDFCQLPPVNAEFCFKANSWKELFDENVIKLERIWRQDNPDFIDAINAMRGGLGKKAVQLLKKCGVRFERQLDRNFDGTTLIPNNRDVDNYNTKKLSEVNSPMIRIQPTRRGSQAKEWDKNSKGEWGIPFEQRFKIGAYVMILRNDSQNFSFANGDCGTIEEYDKASESFKIRLVRNDKLVKVGKVKQFNYQDKQPDESEFNSMFYPYEDTLTGQWVIGMIEWMPLRLAWASTIHKSQGLSLDKVQIDSRPDFYGYPSMSYVAVSRARTPENLVIIGSETDFAMKVNTNPEVLRWV